MGTNLGDVASITLITAVPGSGKTLRLVQGIVEAQARGEIVYVCNINGLNVPGVLRWDDPREWQDCVPGSVLVVDEAQDFFPTRRSGDPAAYIRAMERIRHQGVRLILATQQPTYLDAHLRGLVGCHEHLVRTQGKARSVIYRRTRGGCIAVDSEKALRAEDHETWEFPVECFALYRSAEVHTVKPRMAARLRRGLIMGGIAATLAVAAFGSVFLRSPAEASSAASAPAPAGAEVGDATGRRTRASAAPKTAAEWAEWLTPAIVNAPWTAPVFGDAKPVATPRLFCLSSSEACRCVTEQGTRYELDDGMCRYTARWGGPYNPFRPEPLPAPSVAGDRQPAQRGGPAVRGTNGHGRIGAAYTGVPVTMAPGG